MAGILAGMIGGAKAMPTYVGAGSGNQEVPVSGTLQVPYPASVSAGQGLIMAIYQQDTVASSITTPSGWTLVGSVTIAANQVQLAVYFKIAAGTEGGTNQDVTCVADVFSLGRMIQLSGGSGVEAAGTASTNASATNLDCVNVTTLGANRVAVQVFGAYGASTTVGDISGESGANYAAPVAEYTPGQGILDFQIASVTSAAAITGGSATLGASRSARCRVGFAVVP